MNRRWYNGFRDHRLFERLTTCFWALGVDKIHAHYDSYKSGIVDGAWNVGAGGEASKEFSEEVLAVSAHAEEVVAFVERNV